MIRSFGDGRTEDLFHGRTSKRVRGLPPDILDRAREGLDLINAAAKLGDLRVPPSNRLEPLKGELKGFYSIRVNNQWRVVFRWTDGDAEDVRVVDYHT